MWTSKNVKNQSLTALGPQRLHRVSPTPPTSTPVPTSQRRPGQPIQSAHRIRRFHKLTTPRYCFGGESPTEPPTANAPISKAVSFRPVQDPPFIDQGSRRGPMVHLKAPTLPHAAREPAAHAGSPGPRDRATYRARLTRILCVRAGAGEGRGPGPAPGRRVLERCRARGPPPPTSTPLPRFQRRPGQLVQSGH